VIEATFAGEDAGLRAVRAAVAARDALKKVQREVENEFHLFGAITEGATTELETGVKVTTGWPHQIAGRFREHAAPSQLLLSEEVRRALEGEVEVAEAVEVTIPGSDPVPGYPLIALR
jgi:class 3 adenylate cyclase